MELWQTLLLAFGGNAALLAVIGLLGKSLLDKLIMRDAKQFEADLKAKTDATVEQLKSDLNIRLIEHQVRFSRLHEKRATVIADIYGYLVEAIWEAESFLSPMQWTDEPEKHKKYVIAMNKFADFYRYFDKHRIYLPEMLCLSLDEFASSMRLHVVKFGHYVRFHDQNLSNHAYEEKEKAWNEGWDAIKTQVPEARRLLEEEFRMLLGATPNSQGRAIGP